MGEPSFLIPPLALRFNYSMHVIYLLLIRSRLAGSRSYDGGADENGRRGEMRSGIGTLAGLPAGGMKRSRPFERHDGNCFGPADPVQPKLQRAT